MKNLFFICFFTIFLFAETGKIVRVEKVFVDNFVLANYHQKRFSSKLIEAFEVDIKNSKTGELHEAYLENDLKIGTKVEFVVRENLVTNINLSKK